MTRNGVIMDKCGCVHPWELTFHHHLNSMW